MKKHMKINSIYQLNNDNAFFIFFNTANDHVIYDWHYDYIKDRNFIINYDFQKYLYTNTISNNHHFSNDYHYDYCINLYNEMLKFDFNINEFIYKEYIGTNIDDDFSIKYLIPKNKKRFKLHYVNINNLYTECNGDYECLMNFNKYVNVNDSYRNMYIGNHCQSIITNYGDNNNKTLLVIGDSQIIPEIPLFAYYYKNVLYYDNRNNNPLMEYELYNMHIDQCLVQMWAGSPIDKYKLINDL